METVNTHGLVMKGLEYTSNETRYYTPQSLLFDEIWYDTKDGRVWSSFQFSVGRLNWKYIPRDGIIQVCRTAKHMTPQELADAVYREVNAQADAIRKSLQEHNDE